VQRFTAAASGYGATVQWQVSTNAGVTFASDTTDAGNATGTLTVASATTPLSGREYRARSPTQPARPPARGDAVRNPKPEAPKVTSTRLEDRDGGEARRSRLRRGMPPPSSGSLHQRRRDVRERHSDAGNTSGTLTVASTTAALGTALPAVFSNTAGSHQTTGR